MGETLTWIIDRGRFQEDELLPGMRKIARLSTSLA